MVRKVADLGHPTACPVSASTSSMVRSISCIEPHDVQHGKCSDAIADEVRRVFGDDDALAQPHVAEVRDGVDRGAIGFGRRNNFQQAHVPSED